MKKYYFILLLLWVIPISAQVYRKKQSRKIKKTATTINPEPNKNINPHIVGDTNTEIYIPQEGNQYPSNSDGMTVADVSPNDGEIVEYPNVKAKFPGGEEQFRDYLNSNIEYPTRCLDEGITAVITLSFVVDLQGQISQIKVVKANGSCPEFTQEAIRLIKKSPRWIPGQLAGKYVKSRQEVKVEFLLAEGDAREPEMMPTPTENKGNVDIQTGSPAYFPGGESEFLKYVQRKLIFPNRCKDAQIQGKVLARFIVNIDGKISNVEILEHVYLCPEFSKEVIRVLMQSPKWIAAQIDGKAVKSSMSIPIQFKLEER